MKRLILLLSLSFIQPVLLGQIVDTSFIKGVDISFVPQIESLGGNYTSGGIQKDVLDIFKESGVNYVRLRIWHTPQGGWCGLDQTKLFAQRVKDKGLKLLLDFHYSDSWADPGKQTKPAAWVGITFAALKDSVYAYSRSVLESLEAQGTLPDMVQIGNEITAGMLWPDGRIPTSNPTQAWSQFGQLVKEGIRGARDGAQDSTMRIMIHIDRGGDNSGSRWFYDNLAAQGVEFDVIGLSYYPWWHGTLTQLKNNINDLALRYGKEIVVAETAYPWTLQWYDNVGNIVGSANQLHAGYPATVEGQYQFLFDLFQRVKDVPNQKGVGAILWAPEYISVQPLGSPWENLTLFDFVGNALNSMRVFSEIDIDTSDAVNVTFRMNASTNLDTLASDGFVQLRGEVTNGVDILASGESLTWDATSQVILQNEGGDYWHLTVRIVPGAQLNYKYWTGHTGAIPTFLRAGWEGPVQDSYRKLVAGTADTVLPVEYYNSTANAYSQFWRPFETKADSVAVYFRVNLRGVTRAGKFNPAVHGPVGVRGENVDSLGILSWDTTKVLLARELLSADSGAFWSGPVYFPKSASGHSMQYKFFVENCAEIDLESAIPNRTVRLPFGDSTIAWVDFNDDAGIVSDVARTGELPRQAVLHPNFPNPFNPSTSIRYAIARESFVRLAVFDVLGRRVKILVAGVSGAGEYRVAWDGKDESGIDLDSGIYLVRLEADGAVQTHKMVLLR